MSDFHAQRLLDLFPSNPASFVQGFPTHETKQTAHGPKRIYRYTTVKRPPDLNDARRHLDGEVSIVRNPLLPDGGCFWCAAESDDYRRMAGFKPPLPLSRILNFFPSKSGGIHAFFLFTQRQYAVTARNLLIRASREMGWWPCEINPKQTKLTDSTPHGNGINLPFFGAGVVPAEIIRYEVPLKEWFKPEICEDSARPGGGTSTNNSDSLDDDSGYWWDDALLAMLSAYKKFIPGFDFHRCRSGYAVPCPGHPCLGGWPDGARHSTEDSILSDRTIVFIKNGWPKFKCMHAHCDGGCGVAKKTVNDWRDYFDPGYVFFDIDHWLDALAENSSR
jgi:hypothetical protein